MYMGDSIQRPIEALNRIIQRKHNEAYNYGKLILTFQDIREGTEQSAPSYIIYKTIFLCMLVICIMTLA